MVPKQDDYGQYLRNVNWVIQRLDVVENVVEEGFVR